MINASYVKDYLIKVKFDDGTEKVVDFTDYIGRGGIFSELREKEYFKRFFIDLNTVCWPNGADVAPSPIACPLTGVPFSHCVVLKKQSMPNKVP
jgi:hypothetical protein